MITDELFQELQDTAKARATLIGYVGDSIEREALMYLWISASSYLDEESANRILDGVKRDVVYWAVKNIKDKVKVTA